MPDIPVLSSGKRINVRNRKKTKRLFIKKEVQEIEKELREDANKKLCLIDSTSNFPTEILSLPYIGLIMLIQTIDK